MELTARKRLYNLVFGLALAEGVLMLALPRLVLPLCPGGVGRELLCNLSYLLALLLPVVFWCSFTGNRPRAAVAVSPGETRPRLPLPGLAVVISLSVITVMAYLNYYLILPFEQAGLLVNVEQSVEVSSTADILLLVLSSVLVPAVSEEIFFRGLLLGRLRPLGTARALLLSALLFALFHANVAQLLYTFFAGLVFGACALLTGRIWLSMLVHALNNAVSVAISLLTEFSGEQTAGYFSFCFDLLLITAALFCLMYLLLRRMREPELYRLPAAAAPPRDGVAVAPVAVLYVLFALGETALTNFAVFYQ